jgi:hypothetical protein
MNSIPSHTRAYVRRHVFDREAPVLLVSRPDGDWCLLCGGVHTDEANEYRVVGIGHLLEEDPTLQETLDLEPNWEAERRGVGGTWLRTKIDEGH